MPVGENKTRAEIKRERDSTRVRERKGKRLFSAWCEKTESKEGERERERESRR